MAAPESMRDRTEETNGSAEPGSAAKPQAARLRIGIDIRRLGDFGVGTYIKNLVHALQRAESPSINYVLIGNEGQFEKLGPLGRISNPSSTFAVSTHAAAISTCPWDCAACASTPFICPTAGCLFPAATLCGDSA